MLPGPDWLVPNLANLYLGCFIFGLILTCVSAFFSFTHIGGAHAPHAELGHGGDIHAELGGHGTDGHAPLGHAPHVDLGHGHADLSHAAHAGAGHAAGDTGNAPV